MKINVFDTDPRKISEPEVHKTNMGSFGIVADLFNKGLKEIGCYAEPDEADYVGICDGINFAFKYKDKKPFLIHVWDMANVLPIELRIMQRSFNMKMVGLSNQVSNLWSKYGVECKTAMPGCDTSFYKPISQKDVVSFNKEEGKFTFLFESALNVRSGLDMAIEAFSMAFGDRKDVQLIIKAVNFNPLLEKWLNTFIEKGVNLKLISGRFSFSQMRELYNYADVTLHVYRHSSWGLGIHQAAACGSQVLVGDFCPSNEMGAIHKITPKETKIIEILPKLVNELGLSNAYGPFNYDEDPTWYDYDLNDYAKKLLYLSENRDIFGGAALFQYDFISDKFSLKKCAEKLVEALK